MRTLAFCCVVLVCSLFATACQQTTVEGVWKGVALVVDDGSSDTIEAKLRKIGNEFTGDVELADKAGKKTGMPMKDVKIEGQQITFHLGDKTCKGTFSTDNKRLTGKCYVGDEGTPGAMSIELTKN